MKKRFINCVDQLAGHYYLLKSEVSAYTKERCSRLKARLSEQDGFGMNEILGIAATLIIAAFIIIPQLNDFTEKIMGGLSDWWDVTIKSKLFPKNVS
jgi:hypothetical protein